MSKTYKEDVKQLLKEMHEIGNNAESCIFFLQTAFIYNSTKPLEDCGVKTDSIKKKEVDLTKKITELVRKNPDLKPYISVPTHLLGISDNIEKLVELLNKKIKDNILFSDRAVTEVSFLLQRLADILGPVSDIILARNIILGRYIQESEAGVTKRAIEYTTLHEERLIEGLCLPVASSLYINMLDAIKGIAWHAKEIATRLTE